MSNYSHFLHRLKKSVGQDSSHQVSDLSYKYEIISKMANSSLTTGTLKDRNIRSWKYHDDMGVPIQIRRLFEIDVFSVYNFVKFFYYLAPNNWLKKRLLKQSLLDDFQVIKEMKYTKILKENNLGKTDFARDIFYKSGYRFNARHLRYVYLVGQIMKFNLLKKQKSQVHVDIGGFYGGLQSILKIYYPKTTFIHVELEHQLYRSYLFHQKRFPKVKQIVGRNEFINFYESRKSESVFIYLLPSDFDVISKKIKVDLVTNFQSFGEMSNNNFRSYINSPSLIRSGALYTTNRFISKPNLEKTFDGDMTILDYILPKFEIVLLGLMPMHHYQISKSTFLGRGGYRNSSCASFELILKNSRIH